MSYEIDGIMPNNCEVADIYKDMKPFIGQFWVEVKTVLLSNGIEIRTMAVSASFQCIQKLDTQLVL